MNLLAFTLAPASMLSQVAFVAICAFIVISFIASAIYSLPTRIGLTQRILLFCCAIGCYCLFLAAVVRSEILDRYFLPLGPIFLAGTVSIAIATGFTRLGSNIAKRVPVACLVGFQGFRLPLELVLHDWYASGTIPETMTWTGNNWDIISGILACLSCWFVQNRQWLAWTFNIVGILLLANVGIVAVLSSPVPFGWHVAPPLELILQLPYAFIVPLCVGGAAFGHVVLTRKLIASRSGSC